MGRKKKPDPTTAYALAVVAGEIVAGRMVRQACQRHLDDLETGHERGLKFDVDAAQKVFNFFSLLCLDGDSDKPFKLMPFAEFILGCLFGWKAADGYRRFRNAYIEMAKGNAKSVIAAGVGLYGLVADGEQAAEIYPAATTREQAGIVFRDARNMANANEWLSQMLEVGVNNISFEQTLSFMRPVSSEHRGLDGKRVHMALIDEIHEHPTPMVVDKMRAGTKGRRQALIYETTNAGYDRQSVCWHHHEYSAKILDGMVQDDGWFAYVCTLDVCDACHAAGKTTPDDTCPTCDDWRDPDTWIKANPSIGTIVTVKYLEEQVREAIGMPSKANLVKRLNFCLWTQSSVRAIPSDKWQLCGHNAEPLEWRRRMLEELRGRPCLGGLDLGSTADLTALVLLFWQQEKPWPVLPFFWVPEDSVRTRSSKDRVPYDLWVQQGFMTPTPGAVTDYDKVRLDISGWGGDPDEPVDNLTAAFGIEELAIDNKFQGQQLATQLLNDGLDVKAYGQGYTAMACPAKTLLEWIIAGHIDHGNNPVLTWMAANAATETHTDGYIKFSKAKSTERIDGIVSATMCVGLAMMRPDQNDETDSGAKAYWV